MKGITYYNKQVKNAGLYYIGHWHQEFLRIELNDCLIDVSLQCGKLCDLFSDVFDLDGLDSGIYAHEIVGKYCRIGVNEEFDIVSIGHIINNDFIKLEDLQREVKE